MNWKKLFILAIITVTLIACGRYVILGLGDSRAYRTEIDHVEVFVQLNCNTNVNDPCEEKPYCLSATWFHAEDFESDQELDFDRGFDDGGLDDFGDAEPATSVEVCREDIIEPNSDIWIMLMSPLQVPEEEDHLIVISLDKSERENLSRSYIMPSP